jgi:hypothetical protein
VRGENFRIVSFMDVEFVRSLFNGEEIKLYLDGTFFQLLDISKNCMLYMHPMEIKVFL